MSELSRIGSRYDTGLIRGDVSIRIVARWNLLDEANDIYGCTHCGKLMFGREKLRAICPNCKTPMEVEG